MLPHDGIHDGDLLVPPSALPSIHRRKACSSFVTDTNQGKWKDSSNYLNSSETLPTSSNLTERETDSEDDDASCMLLGTEAEDKATKINHNPLSHNEENINFGNKSGNITRNSLSLNLKVLPSSQKEIDEIGHHHLGISAERPVLKKEVRSDENPVFYKADSFFDFTCGACVLSDALGMQSSFRYYKIHGSATHIKHYSLFAHGCPSDWQWSYANNKMKIHNRSSNGFDRGWDSLNKERTIKVWYTHQQKPATEKGAEFGINCVCKFTSKPSTGNESIETSKLVSSRGEAYTICVHSPLCVSIGVLSQDKKTIFVLLDKEPFIHGDEFYFYRLDPNQIERVIDASTMKQSNLSVDEALQQNGD